MLLPNKVIAKGYESFAVVSSDGKVHTGVLVSRNATEVVLADPEKKGLTSIPRADVEAMQKAELTLLRDADGDGQADVYSSIESRFRFTGHYHEFAFGPVTNSAGDLFFSTGLSASKHHEAKQSGSGQMSSTLGYRGWVMRVDPQGDLKPFASGLRSPAGIGMSADDELFVTDDQGDWRTCGSAVFLTFDPKQPAAAFRWNR